MLDLLTHVKHQQVEHSSPLAIQGWLLGQDLGLPTKSLSLFLGLELVPKPEIEWKRGGFSSTAGHTRAGRSAMGSGHASRARPPARERQSTLVFPGRRP
jgi:hypothetical protein